ncbi:MAG: DUF4328 domain-containing protein, partial [Chloroflexota bacterium]
CARCGLDLAAARGANGPGPVHVPAAPSGPPAPMSVPLPASVVPPDPSATPAPTASGWMAGAPVPPGPEPAAPGWGGPAIGATPALGWGTPPRIGTPPPSPAPAPAMAPAAPPPGPQPAWAAVMGPPPGPAATAWGTPGAAWGPGAAPAAGAPSLPSTATHPPGRTAGRVTMALLGLMAVLSAAQLILVLPLLEEDTWFRGLDTGPLDGLDGALSLVGLLLAIAYLAWSWKVTDGFPALTGRRPRVGRIGIIAWWFVPFANLVMPATAIADLSGGLAVPGRPRRTWLLWVWWVGFLLSRVLSTLWSIQIGELARTGADDASQLTSIMPLLLIADLFAIVSAVALIAIIRRMEADAVERFAAVTAPASRSPWPAAHGRV